MNKIMNKKKLILLISIILLFFFSQFLKNKNEVIFLLNNKKISLIIADTEEKREKGLGNRDSLPKNKGMLFVFDKIDIYGFWMKNMRFAIDIVWLDENKKIVHIEKNVLPDTFPNTFIPTQKSLYVIETNAGFVVDNDLEVGKILNLTL